MQITMVMVRAVLSSLLSVGFAVYPIVNLASGIQVRDSKICARSLRTIEAARAQFGNAYLSPRQVIDEHTLHGFLMNGKSPESVRSDWSRKFHFTDRPTAGFGIFASMSPLIANTYAVRRAQPGFVSIFRLPENHGLTTVSSSWLNTRPEAAGLTENEAWKRVGSQYGIDIVLDHTGPLVFQHENGFATPRDATEYLQWYREILLLLDPSIAEIESGTLPSFFESYGRAFNYFKPDIDPKIAADPQHLQADVESAFHSRFHQFLESGALTEAKRALSGLHYMILDQAIFSDEAIDFIEHTIIPSLKEREAPEWQITLWNKAIARSREARGGRR